MSESKLLKLTVGPKRVEPQEGSRLLYNEELQNISTRMMKCMAEKWAGIMRRGGGEVYGNEQNESSRKIYS
jgi:hypothetical protein